MLSAIPARRLWVEVMCRVSSLLLMMLLLVPMRRLLRHQGLNKFVFHMLLVVALRLILLVRRLLRSRRLVRISLHFHQRKFPLFHQPIWPQGIRRGL